ncbi:hypothetical protein [Nonomuraea salmonea]|uniref:hypothetical protein n=1 Tax=Nonomuraea salmonea TaxID=46181 RepID=UPI002FEC438A
MRSSWLMLVAGTEEAVRRTPSPVAVISRQPSLSCSNPSVKVTAPDGRTSATSRQDRRLVRSPPSPGAYANAADSTRHGTTRPATWSRWAAASAAHRRAA